MAVRAGLEGLNKHLALAFCSHSPPITLPDVDELVEGKFV